MYGDDEETGSPPTTPEKPESDRDVTIVKKGVPDFEWEKKREKKREKTDDD
ncbi:hypothetical protein KAU45_03235 [bacterium]|nr:hypothetical protein [bacterium]